MGTSKEARRNPMTVWCLMSIARGEVRSMFGRGVKGVKYRMKEKKETKGKKKKKEFSALSMHAEPLALRTRM